ncbi:hypothetical protein KIPB_012147 [Kipferlia bialata]|uniref:Uncharacterized protein n=1 Tax=Kipferlia bialata TaxID=797122 RepID=A0A9K3D5T8_9EUKA|nr:hypothetical protein KIPB_012147 [Kipferlia bialata]|eukprot:g12147.t1
MGELVQDRVLTLSKDGKRFLVESRFLLAFFNEFSSCGSALTDSLSPSDVASSDCTSLVDSRLPSQLANHLSKEVAVGRGLTAFRYFIEAQDIDDLELPASPSLEDKVGYLYGAVRYLCGEFSHLPQPDRNTAEPSDKEIKTVVNALEDRALACVDINDDLTSEPNM